MAENVKWALDNEGPQGRLLVLAHDAHVINATFDGQQMAKARKKPAAMVLDVRAARQNKDASPWLSSAGPWTQSRDRDLPLRLLDASLPSVVVGYAREAIAKECSI